MLLHHKSANINTTIDNIVGQFKLWGEVEFEQLAIMLLQVKHASYAQVNQAKLELPHTVEFIYSTYRHRAIDTDSYRGCCTIHTAATSHYIVLFPHHHYHLISGCVHASPNTFPFTAVFVLLLFYCIFTGKHPIKNGRYCCFMNFTAQ